MERFLKTKIAERQLAELYMWPTKMKVDWPCNEIGQKMANGRLLFCTLHTVLNLFNRNITWV